MNKTLLGIFVIISLFVATTGEYVEHVEKVNQDYPSMNVGYTYKYSIKIKAGTSETKYFYTLRIDGVEVLEDHFKISYTITYEGDKTGQHSNTISVEYGQDTIDFEEIRFYNTRDYDNIIQDYDSNRLDYYWFGTTPIRALILEKNVGNLHETVTLDESLGVILHLTMTNSTHTINYDLVDTNAISKYLGFITLLGIIIGIIIMVTIYKELKK